MDVTDLINIKAGEILFKKGDYNSALKYLLDVDSHSKTVQNSPIYYGILCADIANIYFIKNEDKKAIAYYEKALPAFADYKAKYVAPSSEDNSLLNR